MPTGNPYLPVDWEIVDLREEIPGHFFLAMVLPDNGWGRPFPQYRPGQFFEVTVAGIGEAPLSVTSTPTRPGVLEMCFRKMGRVTGALARMRPGMHVGLRGPLGNGYPMERVHGKDVLLLAGGMGMVPLRSLMKHVLDCPDEFGRLTVLYGANDDESFLFFRELIEARKREGASVRLIAVKSRPGSPYQQAFGPANGFVTDLVRGACPDPAHTFVAMCGPPIFYKYAVKTLLAEGYNKNQVYMSLERRMECGIGKCGHCTVGYRYTCIEGPIFNYWDAFNLPELIEVKDPGEEGDSVNIGIFGLTGCAGDQLAIINCEDELLQIARRVNIASFTMASSAGRGEEEGEFDLVFVEGSVCQPKDRELLLSLRARSKALVALGTCACFGGLPAMDAHLDAGILKEMVYGRQGAKGIEAQRAQPLSAFVKVDFELSGCPVEKGQILETVACLLKGEFPELPPVPVCAECRLKENLCVVIEGAEICCGSMTRAGCGARCPSLSVPCKGCHGPLSDAYLGPREVFIKTAGISRDEVRHRLLLFSTPTALDAKLDKERE